MMKPYPFRNLGVEKLVFKYRLSRARRVIENTFGIAASRFRIFHRPIVAQVHKVKAITKAVVSLHNFLIDIKNVDNFYDYCPLNFVDHDGPTGVLPGLWRQDQANMAGLIPINRVSSNNYSENTKTVRDTFRQYFTEEGAVTTVTRRN